MRGTAQPADIGGTSFPSANGAPLSEQAAISFLGRFLFTYEQARGLVGNLSGGERSRLQLVLLMLSGANFLVLDEPTNNLDIPSAEVLEEAPLAAPAGVGHNLAHLGSRLVPCAGGDGDPGADGSAVRGGPFEADLERFDALQHNPEDRDARHQR